MIVQGCGTLCWIDCALMMLVGPVFFTGAAAVFTSAAKSNSTDFSELSSAAKNEMSMKLDIWFIAAGLCYIAAVGLGLWVVCYGNHLTTTDMNSLGNSPSPAGRADDSDSMDLSGSDEEVRRRRQGGPALQAWSSGCSSEGEEEKGATFSLRRQRRGAADSPPQGVV
ncbi:hypothetical protein JCM6882_003969 [Rhodosporidiobolus microsporus]